MHSRLLRSLMLLVALTAAAVAWAGAARERPLAKDGTIDLRGWDIARDGTVALAGEWRWYPHAFVTAPASAGAAGSPITVPGAWNGTAGTGASWGSYALTIQCDAAARLVLLLPAPHSAARWLLDGVPIHQLGRPAATAEAEQAQLGTRAIPLATARCPMQLVVQVSNFQHAQGGLVHAPLLGDDALVLQRGRGLTVEFAQMCCFALLGALTLAFYLVRRRELSGLWFGLFCWTAMAYTGLASERPLERLGLELPLAAFLRLEYLAWFAIAPLLLQFVRRAFPDETRGTALRGLLAVTALPLLVVLAVPAPVFTAWMPVLQWTMPACLAWVAVRLALAARRRREGALPFLAGMLAFAALVALDCVRYGRHFEWPLAPFGMLAFVLAAAAAMAQRLARALTAQELRGLEQRHRANLLVRATKAGIVDWDATTGRVTYSERYKQMLGHAPDADTRDWPPFFEQLHPDDRAAMREAFVARLHDPGRRNGYREDPPRVLRLLRKDGAPLWVQAEGIALVGGDGRTLRYIGTCVDITHLKATEQSLALERERLRLLVRSTKAGFGDWDAVNDVVTYTDRFKEMLGYPADHDTRQWPSIFEMMHPDDRETAREQFRQMIRRKSAGGEQEPGEPMSYRLVRRDGSHVWIHAEGISLVDDSGRTRRFITSYLDVTGFRAQEQALRASHDQIAAQAGQLERQNEALKENVRLREDMERIGRHDLKTPLNAIIAVPRLLRERGRLDSEDGELLGIVERAGHRILNLVNLSLDLFRMEQGSYHFRPQPVDLLEVLRNVIGDVRAHAAAKGLRIGLRVDGAEPAAGATVHAWAEDLLCYSILANLAKNAIEAAPEASPIDIDIRRGETLVLTLHNHGAVPAAVRERFFDKYATAGKSDGTGLGTYSAWLMARIQGGALQMRTSEADGTTLELQLQRAGDAQAAAQQQRRTGGLRPAPVAAEDLPAWRVLAVDDDEFNLLVMRRCMPSPPLTVHTAVNGRAALDVALQVQPDLVLIDLDMPVMDGLEATRRLRAHQRTGRLQPARIVMLSSHDDEATRRRALDAGCDHYLCKPVSKEVLLQTLLWAAGRLDSPPEAAMSGGAATSASADDPAAVVIDPDLVDRIPAFLQTRRVMLDELAHAAGAGDADAVRRHAHRLAGSFGLYGLQWAADRCRGIERGSVDAAALPATLAALRAHLDGVEERVQNRAQNPVELRTQAATATTRTTA